MPKIRLNRSHCAARIAKSISSETYLRRLVTKVCRQKRSDAHANCTLIAANQSELSVAAMCDCLKVSKSGYWDWYGLAPSKRTAANVTLLGQIEAADLKSDTNVVAELMRRASSRLVLAWLDAQVPDAFWLARESVAELIFGIAHLPNGTCRQTSLQAAQRTPEESFTNRLLAFYLEAASSFTQLAANCERTGRLMSWAAGEIASICLTHAAGLLTHNEKACYEPWR